MTPFARPDLYPPSCQIAPAGAALFFGSITLDHTACSTFSPEAEMLRNHFSDSNDESRVRYKKQREMACGRDEGQAEWSWCQERCCERSKAGIFRRFE